MPNETFKIESSKLYVLKDGQFEYVEYPFEISPSVEEAYLGKDVGVTELGEDEYWVLGDHRDKSRDCGTFKMPIKQNYIIGVLVAIEGRAKLKVTSYICERCGRTFKEVGMCPNCYIVLTAQYDLTNKEYRWPRYY